MIKVFIIALLIFLICFLSYFNFRQEKFSNKSRIFIPKVIYKSGKEEKDNLSPEITDLFNRIKKNNPDIEIEYYSDKDCEEFLKKNFNKQVNSAYKKLKPGSFKADLFRYCILYKNGGIWSDLTDDFLVPIEDIINFKKDTFVLARDNNWEGYDGIQIGFMASVPNNPIYLKAINKVVYNVENNIYGKTVLDVTGPKVFYDVLNKDNKHIIDKIKIVFDGNGPTGCYIDKNTQNKIIKYKSLKDINKILKRNNSQHYPSMWQKKDIYN